MESTCDLSSSAERRDCMFENLSRVSHSQPPTVRGSTSSRVLGTSGDGAITGTTLSPSTDPFTPHIQTGHSNCSGEAATVSHYWLLSRRVKWLVLEPRGISLGVSLSCSSSLLIMHGPLLSLGESITIRGTTCISWSSREEGGK